MGRVNKEKQRGSEELEIPDEKKAYSRTQKSLCPGQEHLLGTAWL